MSPSTGIADVDVGTVGVGVVTGLVVEGGVVAGVYPDPPALTITLSIRGPPSFERV